MWRFFVICFDVAVFLFALMWPFFVVCFDVPFFVFCFDVAVFFCNERFVFDALFMSFLGFKL
jgi:hypothetical protein